MRVCVCLSALVLKDDKESAGGKCNITTHSNTHSLFVVLHTGYRERWSVCVFIKMVIGYNCRVQVLTDLTPSTH